MVVLTLCSIIVLAATGCRSEDPASPSARGGAGEPTDSGAHAAGETRRGTTADTTTVLVFGNSLAAGYGLPQDAAFPALLEQKADSAGYERIEVINAGNSGETTAGGRRRIDWLLQRKDLDVLLLELGGNDALRGLPPDSARANLKAIITKTKARFPDVHIILAGMKAPPTLGTDYTRRFERIYPDLAEETGARLIPFLLKGVAGRPALNQPDGIHPTAEGQRRLAENAWAVLGPLLEEMHRFEHASGEPSAAVGTTVYFYEGRHFMS